MQDAAGALQWEAGDGSRPTRVALVIDEPRWTGYSFWLAYNGRELVEVRVLRDGDAEPLAAALFQRIPLGALDRAARECVSSFLAARDETTPTRALALFPDPLDWLDEVADGITDTEADKRLAMLCLRYLELRGQKDWRQTLADEFHYSLPSVQTIIGRARKRRFLTPVSQGQNGGQLTPKALRLLAPPRARSAWDRATDEIRAAAMDRERWRTELESELHALLPKVESGEISKDTYGIRSLAIDAAVAGWSAADLYPDHPDIPDIQRQIDAITTEHESEQNA
jgi:hypothetical protein